MDIIDRANEVAAIAVEARISVSADAPAEVEAVGVCLNCSAPVPDGHRWCDADCRNDWQARRNRKAGRLG
ncbi:MAG: DUF2116 family Zn-ribbon domain-containing protein [Rhodocyclales bacterium]|nr:DUF2116 family Zn-ribbon domain-containing protein [Rhodocyclales bacterium]